MPSPQYVSPEFALDNLPAIIAHTKKLDIVKNVFIAYQKGVRTDRNRNQILKMALDQGDIDVILWLDVDMLYPHDILEKILSSKVAQKKDKWIIGSIYFKRGKPYEPILYVKSDKKGVFNSVDPRTLKENSLVKVDALGYGGMCVSMKAFEAMGEDKWTKYGKDFHLPFKGENRETHDLNFCTNAGKYKIPIYVQSDLKCGHIGDQVITMDTWINHFNTVGRIREVNINTGQYWNQKYSTAKDEYTNKHVKQTERWDKALEYIQDKQSVLDMGCGIGAFLDYANKKKKDLTLFGLDISTEAISVCNTTIKGIFAQMNFDEAKSTDVQNMDVVFCGETLEHVDDPKHTIKLAYDSLKDGGLFIVTTPFKNRIDSPEHINSFDESLLITIEEQYLTIMQYEKIFGDKVMFIVAQKRGGDKKHG